MSARRYAKCTVCGERIYEGGLLHRHGDGSEITPVTWHEDDQLRDLCHFCGGDAIAGTTCPKSIPCPCCKANAGSPCKRPSGHRAPTLHAERVYRAELQDFNAGLGPDPKAKRPDPPLGDPHQILLPSPSEPE